MKPINALSAQSPNSSPNSSPNASTNSSPNPRLIGLALSGVLMLTIISGCGADQAAQQVPTEILSNRAWQEKLNVDGEIKAAANTPLNVPGTNWENRTLIDMVPEGSLVKKGQVIAKFDAPRARVELSQAETELLRKAIGEQGINATAQISRAELSADSAKVDGDLRLSKQYANADLSIFEKNKILDTLVDIGFLNHKSGYLDWKTQQVGARTGADIALLSSQKETVQLTVNQKRKSLGELDLIAPHDGVFLLREKWDGSKASIGGSQWAGDQFGSLPDLNKLVATFSVAEGQAFGLKPGLPVHVRLEGTGGVIELKITKVGKSASTKSSESPVKYSDFEADIDHATALRWGLKPGQALSASVQLVDQASALTAPNVALVQDGAAFFVYAQEDGKCTKHPVELGQRGPIRSQIKSGLAAGAQMCLLTPAKESKS
jgi:HlyD family secretion protein